MRTRPAGNGRIEPLAYIRTPDKFMTAMHYVAPVSEGGDHWVPFFNPGSNTSKVSHLRLINPGTTKAEVTVTGRDDAGDAASGTVRLTLPAGAARTLTAQALEAGGEGIDGSLGDHVERRDRSHEPVGNHIGASCQSLG